MTTTATKPDPGRSRASIAARTLRTDRWWFPPLITFVGLSAWVIYATVRVFMHKWYFVEEHHYLTPFYSPCLTDRCVDGSALFGTPLPSLWLLPEAALTLHLRGKKPAEMEPILALPETRATLQQALATFAGSIRVRPRPVIA